MKRREILFTLLNEDWEQVRIWEEMYAFAKREKRKSRRRKKRIKVAKYALRHL